MNNTMTFEDLKNAESKDSPTGWKISALGEITKISSGGSAPQGSHYFGGKNPFIRVQHISQESDIIKNWDLITDTAIQKYKLKLFPKGTIVFPKSGASIYLEKRARLPLDAYIVSHLCAVNPNSRWIDQDFLFYELKALKLSKDKADGYPTLNLSEIRNVNITIPPLPEQKKIAVVLSAVQEAKEKTEEVIKAAKELKKSLMRHLFTYGPVSIEEAEGVELQETEIGIMPKDWQIFQFENCIKKTKVKVGKIKQSEYQTTGNYPIIDQGQDFIAGYSNDKNKLYVGDLPVIIFGDHTRIIKFVDFPFICGADGTKVLVPHYDLNANYLYYQLSNAKIPSRGYNRHYHLLKEIKVAVPSLPIQQQIVDILSAADQKIEAGQNKKKALTELFKTLLNNLMTGKIRVHNLEIPK